MLKKCLMNLKIEEVPFGIASRVGNTIYVNKHLKKFNPNLYKAIIIHETMHSQGYSLEDIKLDLMNKELTNLKGIYYRFIFNHPYSLVELLPLWRYKGAWQFNITLFLFYFIIIVGGFLITRFL